MRGLVLLVGVFGVAFAAFAQTGGLINGETRDPSGALIPNASVTVTNMETGVARSTITNTSGIYSFPDLTPGVYEVKVMVPGFDTVVETNIPLQVQQTARVDFTLTVGQSTQTVEVAANAALLSTENATIGTVIEQQRIIDLPLNGRSFQPVALKSERDLRIYSRPAGQQPTGRLALHTYDRHVLARAPPGLTTPWTASLIPT